MSAVSTQAPRSDSTAWQMERVIPIAFGIAFAAIAASALLVWRSLQDFRASTSWVSHTHVVLERMEQAFGALNEAIADVREYVVTEDRALLTHQSAALKRLDASVNELKRLTAGDADQHRRVLELERMIGQRVDMMSRLVTVRETQGFDAARRALMNGGAATLIASLRTRLDELQTTERTLLAQRLKRVDSNSRRLMLSAAGLLFIVAITIGLAVHRINRELHARRRLTDELSESRRFFQSVFEHMPNMVFIKDARDLRYVAFNPAAEKLARVSRDQVIGKTDFDLFPHEQAVKLTNSERALLEAGGSAKIAEEHLRIRKGEDRILATRKAVIAGDDGTALYLLGISEDITERVVSRKQTEALNVHLQALNESLSQKSQALEAANKELESFSYSVSHDLRAPLRAVNSYALMLEEDYGPQLPDEARRFITVIRDGANRMGRLIEDLLAFSRLGRATMKLSQVDSNVAVSRALQEVLDAHTGPRPEIVISELPSTEGDPALLHQVWLNLIGNAVKYSSKVEAPRIEIGSHEADGEVVYCVKDNGAGFDMRYVNKLFGVFQRLHGHDEFPGTGVGLAIVHRVIVRHGGRIWAESEPGKGATFWFTLNPRITRGEAA
jgi:PAS domain S-box-containing protein